jgi:hypothetical protein
MSKGQCTSCGDVVESKHRHDFVRCKCGESFLDGGDEYSRYGGSIAPISESYGELMTAEEFFSYLDKLDEEERNKETP